MSRFKPKETPPVEPETPTAFMRKHPAWKMVLDYCLKHANKGGFVFLISLMGAGGWNLNERHAVTQEQLGLIWHQIHQIQDNLGMKAGDTDSSGKICLTNNPSIAKVNP